MDRGIVSLNRHLKKKWDVKMQTEHRERIRSIPKQIDNKPPPTYRHMEYKPKTVQMKEGKLFITIDKNHNVSIERYTMIERNNKILMDKMAYII